MRKGCRYPPEPLTEKEVYGLLRACRGKSATGKRNRAMIAVMYWCGLRVGEALDLRIVDVDVDEGAVRVLHGKGNRSRIVGMPEMASDIVYVWLEAREACEVPGEILFPTLHGRKLYAVYVRQFLRRCGKKAGIRKRVHPHGLRHSFAVQFCKEGASVPMVSRALGHSSIARTHVYLDHVSNGDVVRAMKSRVPANGSADP